MKKSAVTKLIGELEAKGLVIRDKPKSDRRFNALSLSLEGEAGPAAAFAVRPGWRRYTVLLPPGATSDRLGVARALRNNLGGIRSCYERAVRNAPTLAGRLSLRFTVGESGRARAVSADGLTSEVSACVESAVQRIVFPVPACGAESYEFPINFDTGSR